MLLQISAYPPKICSEDYHYLKRRASCKSMPQNPLSMRVGGDQDKIQRCQKKSCITRWRYAIRRGISGPVSVGKGPENSQKTFSDSNNFWQMGGSDPLGTGEFVPGAPSGKTDPPAGAMLGPFLRSDDLLRPRPANRSLSGKFLPIPSRQESPYPLGVRSRTDVWQKPTRTGSVHG